MPAVCFNRFSNCFIQKENSLNLMYNFFPNNQKELAERKADVYATLVKLQDEVKQITEITEILKDADNIKDSKTFVEEIKKEFGVSLKLTNRHWGIYFNWKWIWYIFSINRNGLKKHIEWENIYMNAVNICNRYRICTFAHW